MTTNKNEFSISIALVVGLLLAVGLIYLFVFSMAEDGFGKNMARVKQQDETMIATRIKPVVTLADITGGKEQKQQPAVVASKSPRELFEGACMACHGTGVAGAPKLGDAAAWRPRFETGMDALMNTAKTGKGAMPPNGGSAYSEQEIRSVIEFMLAEAGLIQAPAADATAAPEPEIQAMPEVADDPVTKVSLGAAAHDLAAGESTYRSVCFACHDTGAAGAPKLGDAETWSPRVATGFDALLHSALNGKGAMPAKGGAMNLSDAEIGNVVAFMLDKVQ